MSNVFLLFTVVILLPAISFASDTVEIESSIAVRELSRAFPESEIRGENCTIVVSRIETVRGGLELSIVDESRRRVNVAVVPGRTRVFKKMTKGAATLVRYIVFDQDNRQSFIEIETYEDLTDLLVEIINARGRSAVCMVRE